MASFPDVFTWLYVRFEVLISVSIGGTNIFKKDIKINPPTIINKIMNACNKTRGMRNFVVK